MGHYDWNYAYDEIQHRGKKVTQEDKDKLIKEVKENGGRLVVYDDFNGVWKSLIAYECDELTYQWNASMCEIVLKEKSKK